MARLRFVMDQIKEIEQARLDRIALGSEEGMHAMVRVLAGVKGIGVETGDMLVHEIFSRPLRDRRAVARYAGLTGSPDESGGANPIALSRRFTNDPSSDSKRRASWRIDHSRCAQPD
jgi:transposase